jgi:ATP-grasp domain
MEVTGRTRMSKSAHLMVINRWQETYARYESYVDHQEIRVSYVSTEVGLGSVPDSATDVAVVDSTENLPAVTSAVRRLAARHGRPGGVVALKEDDLLVGARLREEWDLPGQRSADLLPFRDKLLMCRAVAAAGLPVPRFTAAIDTGAVLELARTVGWPLVLKPRIGSSSAGVVVVRNAAELADVPLDGEPMLAQEFNPHQIYHVDGIFTGQALDRFRASRYSNTCLGFRTGSFLGSVEEDDPQVNRAIGAATAGFLAALTGLPTPFHLELFVQRGPDGDVRCTFLEVGARVGGAEIPFIWRDLHGYDLMEAAFRIQLEQHIQAGPELPGTVREVGGWLLIPAPVARPCVIQEAPSMLGRDPGPYSETLLRPGDVLPAADAYYEHVGGRFRFRGRSSPEVEAALIATASNFRVRAGSLRPDPAPAH